MGARFLASIRRTDSVLLVLVLVNILNLADRMVLSALIEPIKEEFGLSDTRIGLLAGLAFALVYSTFGLPIARIADRLGRRFVIAISFTLWSVATAMCGLTVGFWTLLAARVAVAIGEAGFGPAAQAMIADRYPPATRSGALGVFAMGSAVGSIVGVSAGAMIADSYGWRMAFFALGGAGVGFAWTLLFLPKKEALDEESSVVDFPTAQKARIRHYPKAIWTLIAAAAAHLFVSYGMTWHTAFFMRSYGLSLYTAGLWIGIIGGVSGVVGALLGGWLGNVAMSRGAERLPLICAYSVLSSIPFALAAYFAPSAFWAFAAAGVMALLNGIYQAPTYAALQFLAPSSQRATAAALMIFVQNIVGMGLGPVAVGALSDALEPSFGSSALRWALASVFLVNIISAAFYLWTAKLMKDTR